MTFSFLKYEAIKCRFSCPVARLPAFVSQPFCAPLVGCCPHVSFQVWIWYDHPVLSYCNFHLDTLRDFVTLTFWPWSHVTWCHLGGQSLYLFGTGYDLPFPADDDYNFPLTDLQCRI